MIEIPLTQGKVALIDDEDLPLVSDCKWHFGIDGYATGSIKLDGKWANVFMHRLIAGTPQGMDTDHIDGNRLNNKRANLRFATKQQNAHNRPRRSNNTSGLKGVTKSGDKWEANVWKNRKRVYYGRFSNSVDAARAYDAAARQHFGEFARTNF